MSAGACGDSVGGHSGGGWNRRARWGAVVGACDGHDIDGLHGGDDVLADPFLAQSDHFVDIGSRDDSVGLELGDDDIFAHAAADHVDDFVGAYGSTHRSEALGDPARCDGWGTDDDRRLSDVSIGMGVGLLLIELLALPFVGLALSLVGLTLSFVTVALVSDQSAGDGTDGTADQGSFGGLVFVVMADDSADDGSGKSA